MLDSWMEKLMQNAVSTYLPRFESMAESRRAELTEIKSKIRTKPEEVEEWFDKEILKLGTLNVSDMLNKLR
jgi:hypothetical protein